MGTFFKRNDFRTDYKKRPNDEYKALYEKLDEETKQKFARRRTWILTGVIALVFILIIVLAVTGKGTGKARSAGMILGGSESITINCLGDSITKGTAGQVTYPGVLKEELSKVVNADITVNNYGDEEGLAGNTTYKKMNEACDIAILLYTFENYHTGSDPEGILEANVDGLSHQGTLVYLVSYPYAEDAGEKNAVTAANQYIAKVAKDKNILLLDADAYFKGVINSGQKEEDLFEEDGIHLTEKGYELLGTFIAEGLLADAGMN